MAPNTACFHCGLPVPSGHQSTVEVFGQERRFCCHGCLALCETIVAAGLSDYYRNGGRGSGPTGVDTRAPALERFLVYDHPQIQKSFVRAGDQWKEARLAFDNIRCTACLWLNEQRLRALDGVIDVQMDHVSHQVQVRWLPDRIRMSGILSAIAQIGYVAHPFDPTQREHLLADQKRRGVERLLFAGIVGMVVMQFSLGTYLAGEPNESGTLPLWVQVGRWTSLFAATTLLAYSGQDFFAGAWRDIRNGRLGMDVPVVIGLLTAYLGSLAATLRQTGEVYYDSIAMFVFLLLATRFIELRGRIRAADALDRFSRVVPEMARRLTPHGNEEVAVIDLAPGDRIRILPGEIVPADGVIIEGYSSFDESLLTGESLPLERGCGARVVAGACNVEQAVTLEISKVAEQSTAAQIAKLVAQGVHSAPRSAVLAERAASWIVAAVVVLAAATAAFWTWYAPSEALSATIAVLIVTCPCALALATPVALVTSAGRFARMGVLPLRMRAVEALAASDVLALDKTGILTHGRLALHEVRCVGSLSSDEALRYAAALEVLSEHPVGQALRALRPAPGIVATTIDNTPGSGVSGYVEGKRWRLGKRAFAVPDAGVDPVTDGVSDAAGVPGALVVFLADEQGIQAAFVFHDTPRTGIEMLVPEMRRLGIRHVALLSGDQQENVSSLAKSMGADEALGERLPAAKLDWITRARRMGRQVIMVGDGINDAPTLAAADASVSFAGATDLAKANSDFVVLSNDLRAVADSRRLARHTRRVIRQNLSWAAAYNLAAVPAAAMGLVPPWAAAIGMFLSSTLVVVNALRLQRL